VFGIKASLRKSERELIPKYIKLLVKKQDG
jgi:hypothetical protein